MYCNKRLLRGIKRKIDEEGEEETDESFSSPFSNNSRVNESLLRDCLVNQNFKTPSSYYLQPNLNYSYARQRHFTFNISMCKLNRYRQSSDPSLLRSVLICNTLKRLEKELEKEGIKINFGPSGVSFIPSCINGQSLILDPPPNVTTSTNKAYLETISSNSSENFSNSVVNNCNEKLEDGCDKNENDNEKYLLDLDSSSGRFTPFIRSPVDSEHCLFNKEDGNDSLLADTPSSISLSSNSSGSSASSTSALWNMDESTDRLTSLNWSSVLNFDSSSLNNNLTSRNQEISRLSDESSIDSGLISASLNDTSSENELDNLEERYNNKNNGIEDEEADEAEDEEKDDVEDDEEQEEERSGERGGNHNINKAASHTFLHTLLPSSITSDSSSTMSHLINHHHHLHHISHYHLNTKGTSSNSSYSIGSSNDEIFGDIDLSLYDFDLISPLSPPNVKLAPVSAEELMRSVSSDSTNTQSSASSLSSSLSPSNQYNLSLPFSSSSNISSTSSSPSSNTCGTSMTSSSSFQTHYFTSKDKLFLEDMPTTVMS